MIKPILSRNSEDKLFYRRDVSYRNNRSMEMGTIPEQSNNYTSSANPFSSKFVGKIRKTYRPTLSRTATTNFVDPDMLPLYQACKIGNSEKVRAILGRKYKKSDRKTNKLINTLDEQLLTPIHHATMNQHIDIITYLLSKGANIDAIGGQLNRTPLLMAIEANQSKAVRHLLDRNADILAKDCNNQHVLHLAAQQGNIQIAQAILDHLKHYDISLLNDGDNYDMTPLHYAVENGHYEICQLLLNYRCRIALTTKDGSTPLHLAAYRNDMRVLRLLLSTASQQNIKNFVDIRDDDGKTALYIAVEMSHYEMAKLCLDYGASTAQIQNITNSTFKQGKTKSMLHIAAISGNIDIAKLLLSHKAQTNTLDEDNYSVMHYATLGKSKDMIQFLHQEGLPLNCEGHDGMTPLLLSVQKGYVEVTNKLLDLGVDITATDHNNKNCLHYATYHQNNAILCTLLKNGAISLINDQDYEGHTPLLTSIHRRDIKIVRILLDHGADTAIAKNNGDTILHLAAIHNCHHIIQSAIDSLKTTVDIKNNDGKTPLHIAAQLGHRKIVQILLESGAYVNNCDTTGNTPVHDAAENDQKEVIELLIQHRAAVNYTNRKKESPLHLACKKNALNAVKTLISNNADISITDFTGNTCFNIAIENCNTEVGLEMIRNQNWRAVMEHRGSDGYLPMKKLIEKTPKVAEAVMDRCVVLSNHSENHPDAFITFNYQYIESPPQNSELKEIKDKYLAISSMVEHNRTSLLSHPLTMAYRMDKWKNGIGLAFYSEILIYFILICGYVTIMGIDLFCNSSENITNNASMDCEVVPTGIINAAPVIILIIGALVFIFHCIHFYIRPTEAIKNAFVNLEEAIIGLCSIIFGILSLVFGSNVVNSQVGALLVFLSLMIILVQLQRTKFFGPYILMFITVFKTVIKVMVLVFLALIIFGISFQFAFNAAKIAPFNEFITSCLKILVMFLGEIDFSANFGSRIQGLPPAQVVAIALLLIAFVLIVNVTLANLLTALAVGDIHALQQTAQITDIIHALVLISEVNCELPLIIRKKLYTPISVYRMRGPRGKFRHYIWESTSQRAALIKCVQDRLSPVQNESNLSYELQISAKDKDLHNSNAKLHKSIAELKRMIEKVNAKVDAITESQA